MEHFSSLNLHWNIYKKIAFRFVFIFFILYIVLLDHNMNIILWSIFHYAQLQKPLEILVTWIGKHLFHIQYTIILPATIHFQHNDSTYIYLLYFTIAAMAMLGTIVWGVLDSKRKDYKTLYYWLTTIVRYYLASTLFIFALEKFFKTQFPDLGFYRLTEPLGDMSPMGLAWAFFGYSKGYNLFMGVAESAALLLLFRRTMTFGAILTLGALANVVAVNYNYDIHAKIYPTALFAMAFFLLLNDAERLIKFFFTGQSISLPTIQAPLFKKRWMNISKMVFKFLAIGVIMILPIVGYWSYKKSLEETYRANSKLYGVYDVETFVINKDTLSNENPVRWRQLVIGDMIEGVRLRGDSVAFADVSVKKKEILFYGNSTDVCTKMQEIYNEQGDNIYMDSILIARQIKSSLHFQLSDSTTLKLRGKINNDSVFIVAKRKPLNIKHFRLMKRTIHWINETDYTY